MGKETCADPLNDRSFFTTTSLNLSPTVSFDHYSSFLLSIVIIDYVPFSTEQITVVNTIIIITDFLCLQ